MNTYMPENEILAKIPGGVAVLNEQNQIVYANQRLIEFTGILQNDLLGSDISVTGLEMEFNSDGKTSPTWLDWSRGVVIHRRSSIRDDQKNMIPVLVSAIRDHGEDNESHLYMEIIDVSEICDWSVEKKYPKSHREQFFDLVGKTPQMQDLYNFIEMASSTGVNVVVQGESGTGKELVASAIHFASARKDKPFVRVNCAALAETLLESELFGHVKGAFTGAYRDRKGTFETAHQGTILLDEIGEISPSMQAKLLRVLQERVIVRVGDNQEIPIDVRIVAATNKNLRKLVSSATFREDLFYRLNVFPITIPSLRERKSDITLLCNHFLKKFRRETGKHIHSIAPDAMRILMEYCWPGNIRELENSIEHAFVLSQSNSIDVKDLPYELRRQEMREGICFERESFNTSAKGTIPVQMTTPLTNAKSITKEMILDALEKCNGNKAAAARMLGISRVGLWNKLKKIDI